MFLLNLGGKWHLSSLEHIQGVVYLPSYNSAAKLRNPQADFHCVLLDPQIYLAELTCRDSLSTCARLASHPWFCVYDLPEFDSRENRRTQWEQHMRDVVSHKWTGRYPANIDESCLEAINAQVEFPCTHIILPTPLIREREDEGITIGEWLDCGIEACDRLEVGQPLLATIAISESALNDSVFSQGGLLDAIVDHVSARTEINGVYIVIAQEAAEHPFVTRKLVHKAYFYLSNEFGRRGYSVVVNFADVFGLVCKAVGVQFVANGQSQSLRRLSIRGFRDDRGGRALPHFYSHRIVAELLTETDLSQLGGHSSLIRRIVDETPYSTSLLEHLLTGRSAGDVRSWAESQNNLSAAQKHFITRQAMEERRLERLRATARQQAIHDWLDDAEASRLLLDNRLGQQAFRGHMAPTPHWLECLSEL